MKPDVVTIFGGAGFVGRYVASVVAKTGARVRVATRRPEQARFLKPMGDVGQVTPIAANVRDDASVAAAIAGSDTVINLVGLLHESSRQSFAAVHAEAPGRIGRLAREAGVARVLHVSAIGADPASPALYARSKAAGEAALCAAFPQATIFRPSIMFGPEDDFFNRFAVMARLAPALPLIGGGTTRFQPVYVGDVAEAVLAALTRDDALGRLYELGGPKIYSFRKILEIVLAETGRKRPLIPIPFALAMVQGALLECLPNPPLTRDQVRMLRTDNVAAPGAPGLGELGVAATSLETIVPTYLRQYRRGGGVT